MSKAAKIITAVVITVAAVVTMNPQLIAAAISADAALVLDAVVPKPKVTSAGQETKWTADARDGIPYAVGRCAVGGAQVFMRSAGSVNKFRNYVTVYTAAGPIKGFDDFYVNDVATAFTADSGEGAAGYYQNRMWLKSQLGVANSPYLHWTATGSKDTPANHGGMPAEWTSAHRLSGYAADLQALEYDTTRYAGGVPGRKRVGEWVMVYDPRKDSTYPGGAGPHRYAEPTDKAAYLAAMATWEWSANPYLHGLMWALGRWTGDPSYPAMPLVKTHGLGAPLSVIDVASFVEGANVAQANSWTLGGVVKSTDDKWEVLKQFLEAGGGEPILLGHKLACMVNAPKVSLATLTKADAVGDVSVAGAVAIEDRLNTIWPSYTEETQNWTVVPFDTPVQVGAYLAPDKGVRSTEMALPLVQSPVQMAQLARYRIEDSRELTPIVIPAKPWTMWLRPGDCITADEPEWGLNGQKLLIMQRKRDPATMRVTFICRTETDGKHAFALGQTATAPDTPALTGIDASVVPLPAGDAWAVVGGVVAGESGSLPGIVIAGEADLYDAVSIVVDYCLVLPVASPSYGVWKSATFPASAKTLVVQGVEPGATYQVRVRYITAKGVENPESNTDLGTIVVGGVGAGTLDGRPVADVLDDVDNTKVATAEEVLRAVTHRGETLEVLEQIQNNTNDNKTFITELKSIDGDGVGKAVLSINADGHVGGTVLMNDGSTASFYVVADEFGVVGTDGVARKVVYVDTVAGKIKFLADVAIDGSLTITGTIVTAGLAPNAATIPLVTTGSSTIYCDGTAKLIMSHTITLDADATLFVNTILSTHFPSGDRNWTAELFIDGVSEFDCGGANGVSTMPMSGARFCSAGDILVEVRLNSHTSVNVTSRTLSSWALKR